MQRVSIFWSQLVRTALVGLGIIIFPIAVPNFAISSHASQEVTISTGDITITAPVAGATPVSSTTSNGQYTTAITWNGFPSTFGEGTVYTATVVVTPDPGFTLTGVGPDFFTVNGAATTPQLFASSTFGVTGANPQGVAVDSLGNIYVTNNNDDNVTKITPQGTSSIFGTTGDKPYGIAIDSFGNVYTSNFGSNNVTKITPQGNSTTFGTTGDDPYYIAIDSSNNVYTANYSSSNVTKITPAGDSTTFGTTDSGPFGIAIDSLGNVYTSNWDAKNLTKITPQGVSTNFGQTGIAPSGLVLDTNGNFYTANYEDNNVSKITPEGVSTIFGTTGVNPNNIKIDTNGNIYTPNVGSDNVTVITPQGDSEILSSTGSGPVDIAFDSLGNLYTANYNAGSVTKITYVGAAGFSYQFPATAGGPQSALNPTFGTPTSTADGFTVSIDNYDPDFTWATPTVSVGSVSFTPGNNWSTNSNSSGSRDWKSITSSSDGTKLAFVSTARGAGSVYTSSDSGATWTERTNAGSRNWKSIASNSDGTKLSAAVLGGYIYTSTDSGATWSAQTSAGSRDWISIASSSDGTKLAAAANGGYIYTSADSGVTWTERTNSGSRWWQTITSSSDGTKLAAGSYNGFIYTSSDSGATWSQRTASGARHWQSIASSSDGTKLIAADDRFRASNIYTSTDSGATWSAQTNAGSRAWSSVASSSDGTKLAAAVYGGYIYTSTDSGATWSEQTSAGSRDWYRIASSSDGTKLAAAVYGGYIYTYAAPLYTVTGLNPGASATITQTTSRFGYNNGSNSVTGTALDADASDTTISIADISIAAPVTGATPTSSISSNGEYTVTVAWNGSPSTFASNTVYTATVTVVPDSGYTLSGLPADFFTVNGTATTTGNLVDAGIFTYTFAATATTISTAAISLTAPATGATPVTSTASNGQFSTTVTWSPAHDRFRSNTVYTATITVTPDSGYTLSGVNANFFTIDGASSVTNDPQSGVVTAVLAATGGKIAQTITFDAPNPMTRLSSYQSLTGTSTAGIQYTPSYSVSTPSICSYVGGAVVQTALGTCVITASQAGDDIYLAADPVVRSFAVTRAPQTITISALNPMTRSSYDQTLVATSSEGLTPITFSTTSPACSIVNGKLRALAPGTCSIVASQVGNSTYAPASAVRSGFVIGKDSQTITFTQPTSMRIGDADRTLNATSSAGLTPVFTSQTPSICSVVAGKIRALSSGSCVIASNQAGNASTSPAQRVLRVVTIRR